MTTHDYVLAWELTVIFVTLLTLYFIAFRSSRERRPLFLTIVIGWVIAGYIWDININFLSNVEYSDHWHMMYSFNGKAEPALAPFIYILWEAVPAIVVLNNRERLERALGKYSIWWIMLGFLLWSFYLDFPATSLRPIWTYYQRWTVAEYPFLAPVVNAFLTAGAYLGFRRLDDLRLKGVHRAFSNLLARSTLVTNVTYATLFVLIFVLRNMPVLRDVPIPYVKSQ